MQPFLQFRLVSHQLPMVLGRFTGGHVARPNRWCKHCDGVAVADVMLVLFECPALHALRQQYAPLFSNKHQDHFSTTRSHASFQVCSSFIYSVHAFFHFLH